VKEEGEGYSVDKNVFEGMIRIRRRVVPLYTAYAAFLLTAFVALVTVMRPIQLSSVYLFAVIVVLIAVLVSLAEAYKVSKTTI
jgi:hypothetical protein